VIIPENGQQLKELMHNNLYFDCFKGIYEKGGNYAEYRQDLADAVILRIYEKAGYQKQ
jgi:hypothetical protein